MSCSCWWSPSEAMRFSMSPLDYQNLALHALTVHALEATQRQTKATLAAVIFVRASLKSYGSDTLAQECERTWLKDGS